jgi:hypothetical protein
MQEGIVNFKCLNLSLVYLESSKEQERGFLPAGSIIPSLVIQLVINDESFPKS